MAPQGTTPNPTLERRYVCEAGHPADTDRGRCPVKVGSQRKRPCGLPIGPEPELVRCGCGKGLVVGGWCGYCGAPMSAENPPSGTGMPETPKSRVNGQVNGAIVRGQQPPHRGVGPLGQRGGRPKLTEAQAHESRRRRREKDRERKRRIRAKALIPTLLVAFLVPLAIPAPAVAHPPSDPSWSASYVHRHPYLVCLRSRETPGHRVWPFDDGYTYNTGNGYTGAFQYRNSTWATAAKFAGYPMVAGTPAYRVSMRLQDRITLAYAKATRGSPWGYACSGWL